MKKIMHIYEKLGMAVSIEDVEKVCDIKEICEEISNSYNSCIRRGGTHYDPEVYYNEQHALFSIALMCGNYLGEEYKLMLEEMACQDPESAYFFAREIPWARVEILQDEVYSSSYFLNEFVRKVPEVNVERIFTNDKIKTERKKKIAEIILSKDW